MADAIIPPRAVPTTDLPAAVVKRGIDAATWSALQHAIYPGAREDSILLVLDYCRARGLDPLKKAVHIVPMEVRDAKTNAYTWRDVVMPGVAEHRITAERTGCYMGHSEPAYGPEVAYKGVTAPEWCSLTMYRLHASGVHVPFPVRVLFREVVQFTKDGKVNARWTKAPHQMLTKCTEAAGLREAFPDALGGEGTAEELDGARAPEREDTIEAAVLPPKPDGFDEWLPTFESAADAGLMRLRAAWKDAPKACREYLAAADPARWTAIQTTAKTADQRDAQPAPLPLPGVE